MCDKIREHVIDRTLAEQFEKYMRKYPRLYQSLALDIRENIPKLLNIGLLSLILFPRQINKKFFLRLSSVIRISIIFIHSFSSSFTLRRLITSSITNIRTKPNSPDERL